jgi:hypothetical protein
MNEKWLNVFTLVVVVALVAVMAGMVIWALR